MNENTERIVNLGGGGNVDASYLTADIDPRADCYVDMTKRLPFGRETIDAIFLEEAVEHIPLPSAECLLRECERVLVPGGVLRIATPDLDYFAKAIDQDGDVAINDIFYGHGHKYVYCREHMRELLIGAGFAAVEESSYRDPDSVLGRFDTHAERFDHDPAISQYWEATKRRERNEGQAQTA